MTCGVNSFNGTESRTVFCPWLSSFYRNNYNAVVALEDFNKLVEEQEQISIATNYKKEGFLTRVFS